LKLWSVGFAVDRVMHATPAGRTSSRPQEVNMPTYQYRCTSCENELEAVQKFHDDPLTDCPDCDGNLRKVYNAVGVVFKGSGFYATDNRTKGKTNAARPSAEGGSGEKPASSTASSSASSSSSSESKSSTGATSAA